MDNVLIQTEIIEPTYPCVHLGRKIDKETCQQACKYASGAIACQAASCESPWFIYRGVDVQHIEGQIDQGFLVGWTYMFIYNCPEPIRQTNERRENDMTEHRCFYLDGKKIDRAGCLNFCSTNITALENCLKLCKTVWSLPCPICFEHFGEKALSIPGCMITKNNRCDGHQKHELDKRRVAGFAEKHELVTLASKDVGHGQGGLEIFTEAVDTIKFSCTMFDTLIDEATCQNNLSTCRELDCECEQIKKSVEALSEKSRPEIVIEESEATQPIMTEVLEKRLVSCERLRPTKKAITNPSEAEFLALVDQLRTVGQQQCIQVVVLEIGWFEIQEPAGFNLWQAAKYLGLKNVEVEIAKEQIENCVVTNNYRVSEAASIGLLMPLSKTAEDSNLKPESLKLLEAIVSKQDEAIEKFKNTAKEVRERNNALEIALTVRFWQEKYKLHYLVIAGYFNKSHSWPWQRLSILQLHPDILTRFKPDLPKKQRPNFWTMLCLAKVKNLARQLILFKELERERVSGEQALEWLRKRGAFSETMENVRETTNEPWVELLSSNWFPVMAELEAVLEQRSAGKVSSPVENSREISTVDKLGELDVSLVESGKQANQELNKVESNSERRLTHLCPHWGAVDEIFCQDRNVFCNGTCGSPWVKRWILAEEYVSASISSAETEPETVELNGDVRLDQLMPSRFLPKINYSKAELIELAEILKQSGQIDLVEVVEVKAGEFELLVDQKILAAARIAGLTKLQIEVVEFETELNHEFYVMVSNQGLLLDLELARFFLKLKQEGRLTYQEIANEFKLCYQEVKNRVAFLEKLSPRMLLQMERLTPPEKRPNYAEAVRVMNYSQPRQWIKTRSMIKQRQAQ